MTNSDDWALILAMEWGFKAHEKGWNLERARIEFTKDILQ